MNHLMRAFLLLFTIMLNDHLWAQASEDHGYDAVIDLIIIGSDYGSFTGKPVRDGMELVSLNGHPIPMWIDESSIIRSQVSSNWLRSRLTGYGKYEFLKVGQNSISLKFYLDNGTLTSGTAQADVYVYPNNNKPKSHLVCSVIVAVGESTGSCSGTYQADLKDLVPFKAEKIQEMLRKIKNHSEWFKLLNPRDFHILNTFLIDNQDRDFDDFNIDNLRDDPFFQDIFTLYNAKMMEVSRLKEGIYAESGKIREELKANLKVLTEELDRENIDINDPDFFNPEIIPDIEEMSNESGLNEDAPSPLAKMYANFSMNMIEQFKISYQNNDRVLLLRQISSWETKYLEFDSSLMTASSPSPQDILALQNAKKMVDAYLYGHLKGYGDEPCIIDLDFWFCDTKVPDDIKELATNNFAHAGVAGENLNKALRTMNPKTFSPEEAEAYFDSLRMLAKYLEQIFQNYRTIHEATKEQQAVAAKMLEDAAQETRRGFVCGAIGLVTGPFFEIVDAVVGRDLCMGKDLNNTERVIKLAGALVFNGKVLQGIGKITGLSPKVSAIAKWMDEIVESARAEYKIIDKMGIRIYSRIHGAISSLPSVLKPKRIHVGTDPEKIAIIGRSMPDVVDKVAEHLGKNNIKATTFNWSESAQIEFEVLVKTFREEAKNLAAYLPYDKVKKTKAYLENKDWIEKIKREGYTILDIGDPFNKNKAMGLSAFYDMEKLTVFGDKL